MLRRVRAATRHALGYLLTCRRCSGNGDDEAPEVKIADFGLSKVVGHETTLKTACGSPSYVGVCAARLRACPSVTALSQRPRC